MRALARKLRRDLWQTRAQVLAVALVAAVGVANLVMSRATLESLEASRDRYYREHAFADVFAAVKRAPESLARRLAAIPGVAVAETRVVAYGRAELPGFDEPVRVQAVSLPAFGTARLNRLFLREGHLPEADARDQLVLSDAFAEAHGLHPGDRITLVLQGRRQAFTVAGVASSPEFVSQLDPQAIFPDPQRFAVAWMPRPALEAAMDLEGAFNDVALALMPGARLPAVLEAVDRELARYGGSGAIAREDQGSHRYLSEEFRQLRTMARLFPAVFLGVAAFVLYVVLARLVGGQREQIGTLKAFGYGRGEIWRHYAGYAAVVGLVGALLGLALGAGLGLQLARLYRRFYRLPWVDFTISVEVVALALAVSLGAALLGAAVPVLRAARLPPAEAMRSEAPWGRRPHARPASTRRRWSQAHRLVLRNLGMRPLRTLLTTFGLAAGTAIILMGRFQSDALDAMVERQFRQAERHDVAVAFVEPLAPRSLHELASLPGVLAVEPVRAVPIRLRHRSASERVSLVGVPHGARLRRVLDAGGQPLAPAPHGLTLTDQLAVQLGARLGDRVEVQTLDGRRRRLELPIVALVAEPFGVQAYLPQAVLDRALGEGPRVSGALLAIDPARREAVLDDLQARPRVAAVSQRRLAIDNFYASMAETILTFTLIATAFGMVITAGVTYSSARVALAERSRDLASLRVLGFTPGEVGYLLLGELALLTLLALPLGFALGHGLVALLVAGFESDLFRIPHHVSAPTYGIAALATLAAAVGSAAVVWRRIHHLDLIAVLKARD